MKMRFKAVKGKKYYGETDFDRHIVKINRQMAKKDGKLGETLRHEEFHVKHPKANEPAAYKAEKKNLPKKQMSKLYARIK